MQHVPEQFTKPPEVRGGERRQRARHSPSALTYVTLGEDNGGIIANISETGMYVTAGQPLRESFFSRLSFRIPQSNEAIETQGEIVWTSESKKEAGVRFVELREESRDLIRKWVAPARRNGSRLARPAENSRDDSEHVKSAPPPAPAPEPPPASQSVSAEPAAHSDHDPVDAEPREVIPPITPVPFVPREPERVPAAVARSLAVSEKDAAPLLAFSGLGPRAWALTEAQRAEFERLFPSENAAAVAHEPVVEDAEIAASAQPVPVAERFAQYTPSTSEAPDTEPAHAEFAVAATEAAADPAPVTASVRPPAPALEPEVPILRGPTDPPPVAQTTPVAAAPRTPMQSLWDAPPPMMQPIIGGSYDRSYGSTYGTPAAESLGDKRSRGKWSIAAVAILVVAACFVLGFIVGPDGMRLRPKVDATRGVVAAELSHFESVVTSRESAATPNTGTAPAVSSNSAPSRQNAPASASAAPAASPAPASGAPTSGEPAQAAPATPAPNATPPVGDNAATNESASSTTPQEADSEHTGDDSDAASAGAPAAKTKESATAAVSKRALERNEAESSRAAREAAIERERAASAAHEAAQPPVPAATPETAKPAPSGSPRTEAPSAAATHPPEPAPRPAAPSAPPESYFPVVAPGAGNVPRLIELPEERIIDTAAVVIHSHQYVFVPAEPGPESSHALEKLQIGDRVTKLAPMYPAEAAQKAMGGTVHLRAIIGTDGHVQDVRPINGPLVLITAAVDAILQWQYRPTLLDGKPIEIQEDFTIEFRPLGLH